MVTCVHLLISIAVAMILHMSQVTSIESDRPTKSNNHQQTGVISRGWPENEGETDHNHIKNINPDDGNSNNDRNKNNNGDTSTSDQVEDSSLWLSNWKKRLDLYKQWLTQMTRANFLKRTKLFSRNSRGRLDRMPFTYGKRSVRSRQEAISSGSENELTQFHKAQSDGMPTGFGKRMKRAADSKVMEEQFVRLQKSPLDRMPFTFGKKEMEDAVTGDSAEQVPGFVRVSKGSLGRMPLGFGKKNLFDQDLQEEGLVRGQRDRMERMPITFGKREKSEASETGDDKDSVFPRIRRGPLDRMPISFGKRFFERNPNLFRKTRGSLDRMPLTFGKRARYGGHSIWEQFHRNDRGSLDRMPISFGKRKSQEAADTTNSNDNTAAVTFPRMSRGRLDRMPLTFGKRYLNAEEDSVINSNVVQIPGAVNKIDDDVKTSGKLGSDVTDSGVFRRVSKGNLDRMPISFGKRMTEHNDPAPDNQLASYFARSQRDRMGRMPLTFGKRGSPSYSDMLTALRMKLAVLSPDKREELNNKFNNFFNSLISPQGDTMDRFQRSRMGRMPLTFGKRTGHNSGIPFPSDLDIFLKTGLMDVQRRSRMSRMPFNFGKRSATPGKRERLHRMPMAFGKRTSSENRHYGSLLSEAAVGNPKFFSPNFKGHQIQMKSEKSHR